MKKSTTTFAIALFSAAAIALSSCGETTKPGTDGKTTTEQSTSLSPEAQELKEFMLGGMYYVNGYGGVSKVEGMIPESNDKKATIDAYREIFLFPFGTEQASDVKSMFSEMWNVNNKADLNKVMNKLQTVKDAENPHKAWDYARIANNACMGYAAGYLTKDEAKKYIKDAFTSAQKEFKTWADYFADYNLGRVKWDPNAEDKASFDAVTADLIKNPKGIYQLLPLNN
jgi:hypothetical protein